MERVLRTPQLHSTFSNLGFVQADGYHVNENCNDALKKILDNILNEDKYLCTYRRSIGFGQNIKKDLLPLLLNAKEDKTIELLLKILVNLTIPIECLLSVDAISRTDYGRHAIFEINNLLSTTKVALTDHRATKVIIEFLKKNSDSEQQAPLSPEQCTNISNTLLFLRNILHIPEDINNLSPTFSGPPRTVQNQLLWNLFSQNIDKVLIKLMGIPDATIWAVTMVQLIALLYKDQHVTTLHKLLNLWLEGTISESSEDNESNTSPQNRGSKDSSPVLTSDPTSTDSSDTGGSGKSNDDPSSSEPTPGNEWNASSANNNKDDGVFLPPPAVKKLTRKITRIIKCGDNKKDVALKSVKPEFISDKKDKGTGNNGNQTKKEKKLAISENSDCGYGTQVENQESISTSSNEDELSANKSKLHTTKANNTVSANVTLQERKRKKTVKKGKNNIITQQGHHTLTDDDISNLLKEFTVDFLLKGYNALVQTLHSEILTNLRLEIDTSHFFWLVTYFLKFATQIELDLEHISSVLSFDIISYLTAEGVNLCEQFELALKLDGNDLKPTIRRLHLVVTAVREFVQAIELYKKSPRSCDNDQEKLLLLQIQMCETQELRSLLVLLIRHYNPKYHPRQYLQDLIVTNHILLMFLDTVMRMPEYKGSASMPDHIRQFASPRMMAQFGLLLEDFECNGEFVNDCVFTMMHHVSGELGCVTTLFQPRILKTFTSLWKSDFETCDDWSDLIAYVINTFVMKPQTMHNARNFRLDPEYFDVAMDTAGNEPTSKKKSTTTGAANVKERFTEDEISSLSWNYMQCNTMSDVIGGIVKLFKEDGVIKTRDSVARELFKHSIINKDEFQRLMKSETERNSKTSHNHKETREDEIGKLCEQLAQDGKSKFLDWVQTVLLETCYAKICTEKKVIHSQTANDLHKMANGDMQEDRYANVTVASPVSYHALLSNQSVPLVPWNCQQASICKDLKFLQLLHRLGFYMPVDSGKVFIRIPHFWTPDYIFDVASKISPIDKSKLKFSISEVMESSVSKSKQRNSPMFSSAAEEVLMNNPHDNYYQIHNQNHFGTNVNYTPMPGSSYNSGENPNWLEMIQKSQEYKISFGLESSILKEEVTKTQITEMNKDDNEVSGRVKASSLVTSTVTTMTVTQEISYNMNHVEPDYCNNSICETASVTSDLTRMYVSDEEDKPDMMPMCSSMDVQSFSDDQSFSDTDSLSGVEEKRPRMHYYPAF